jgi:hypothetical protein
MLTEEGEAPPTQLLDLAVELRLTLTAPEHFAGMHSTPVGGEFVPSLEIIHGGD